MVPDDRKEKLIPQTSHNLDMQECPVCYWSFPEHMTLDTKKVHIENHFA